jgi:hypothetical protein
MILLAVLMLHVDSFLISSYLIWLYFIDGLSCVQ